MLVPLISSFHKRKDQNKGKLKEHIQRFTVQNILALCNKQRNWFFQTAFPKQEPTQDPGSHSSLLPAHALQDWVFTLVRSGRRKMVYTYASDSILPCTGLLCLP